MARGENVAKEFRGVLARAQSGLMFSPKQGLFLSIQLENTNQQTNKGSRLANPSGS